MRILLVEDDECVAQELGEALTSQHYLVDIGSSGMPVTLARSLDMDAHAEGVETPQQLAQLQALREYGQGYFFSKPPASETAWALLNRFHLP